MSSAVMVMLVAVMVVANMVCGRYGLWPLADMVEPHKCYTNNSSSVWLAGL